MPEAAAPSSSTKEKRASIPEPSLPQAPEPDLGLHPAPSGRPQASRPDADPPQARAAASEAPSSVLAIKPRVAQPADKVAERRAARLAAKAASKDISAPVDRSEPEPITTPLAEGPRESDATQASDREVNGGAPDAAGARNRPRIDVVAPRSGRPLLLRNVFVGGVLLIVVGLIAVAAFMLRDKPSDLQSGNTEAQGEATDSGASKYADRIGGEASSPAERRDQGTRQAPSAPSDSTRQQPTQSDVAVAQRAVLFEENTAGGNAQPITFQGMVVWRLEAVNGEQGQPLETVIRGRVTFADAGLSLLMTIRRNLDSTLPASHTIELAFTTTSPAGDKRAVQDVGLLTAKDEEASRGSPVSGLPVRVRENLFLIGLSSLQADIDRNTDLLEHRNWFDLPVKFASGPRGVLTFEKGTSGNQVIRSAFEQWRR
ncbi:histidine kinase [Methylobacterium marchantiae]|uniref:Histidine kinase n=1 Tax=Methylobacterium marchantiae TaxID=600331 RepID=A0ABW3X4F7_9HYPH